MRRLRRWIASSRSASNRQRAFDKLFLSRNVVRRPDPDRMMDVVRFCGSRA